MSETELSNALENARKDLEKLVAMPAIDPCLRHVFDVFKDEKVREHFIKHIKEEDFQSFSCHPFAIEGITVVFLFRCRPPRICIVAPAFCVHYDLRTQSVTSISDPCIFGPQ
jgi:hypothetical protein